VEKVKRSEYFPNALYATHRQLYDIRVWAQTHEQNTIPEILMLTESLLCQVHIDDEEHEAFSSLFLASDQRVYPACTRIKGKALMINSNTNTSTACTASINP
jgi:hypothetical protein